MVKPDDFVHLHVHSEHSVLDGLNSPTSLAEKAAEVGQKALGLSDHGSMSGVAEHIRACQKFGINPIVGIEAYCTPGLETPHTLMEPVFFGSGDSSNKEERSNDVSGAGAYTHLTLMAENNEGMHNLFKLNTLAWKEGQFRKPRMSVDLISQYSQGVIATTGCPSGEVQTRLRLGQWDAAVHYAAAMQDILGKENYFLELMDHNMSIDLERRVRGELLQLAKKLDIPLLATNDLHYASREDALNHEHMLCLQSGSRMSEPTYERGGKRFAFEGEEYYLKTSEEMSLLFPEADYPGAIRNSLLIAERSHVSLDFDADLRPTLPLPAGHTDATFLRQETLEGLSRRLPEKAHDPEYLARVDAELNVLATKGFSSYFLVVSDFVRWTKKEGYPVGPGRGCLSGDSNVLTPTGFKQIRDIRVGDIVFDETGAQVTVPQVFEYDCDEQLVAINAFYGNQPIKMTSDHKVLVSKANRNVSKQHAAQGYKFGKEKNPNVWVRADEVELGDFVVMPKIKFEDKLKTVSLTRDMNEFTQDATEVLSGQREIVADRDLGEIFGLFISDGWLRSEGSTLGFAERRSEDEGHIPNLLTKVFGCQISVTDHATADLREYHVHHKGIVNLFREMFPDYAHTAHTKYIPDLLLNSSQEFRDGLLQGLWYGDGSHKGKTKYTTVSERLAQNVFTLLISLGLPAGLSRAERTENRPEFNKYQKPSISYSVVSARYFDPAKIHSGCAAAFDGEFTYYRVRDIQMTPAEGKVYDFTVPTTHSYVTDSFVVHNSAGGSLVAYCIDITDVDPIAHGTIFERFLNPERDSPPDIDMDFDDVNREKVIDYVRMKYGEEMVSMIITFGKIKAKNAIKDIARIFDEPYSTGDSLTKVFPAPKAGFTMSLADVYNPENPRYAEGEEFRKVASQLANQKIIPAALGVEGTLRSTGVHAAGVIMSSRPIADVIPQQMRKADGVVVTQFDYPTCESLGLIKMDFLGIRNLTVIDNAIKAIKRNHGIQLDPIQIYESVLTDPDEKTYDLLRAGRTLGVFQLDGAGITSLLKLINPNMFGDISSALALYRPGPLAMNTPFFYAERKNGRQAVTPIHPELEEPLAEILGETYGLIVYQEQVMQIAQKVAGYSLGQADSLRRIMGKKKKSELEKEYPIFHDGMIASGYSEQAVATLWEILIPYSEYGFNKSHTVAYGMISYLTAYLKANYPAEFMAANLSTLTGDKDKTAQYLEECRHLNIKVLPPSVSFSLPDYTATKEGDILVGLAAIRGVGQQVAADIATEAENKPFSSLDDFVARAPISALSKTVIEGLSLSGALDNFGFSRQTLKESLPEAAKNAVKSKKKEEAGQFSLFDDGDDDTQLTLVLDEYPEYSKKAKLANERHVLGLYVSDHPLSGIASALDRYAKVKIVDILTDSLAISDGGGSSFASRQKIVLAGVANSVSARPSKKGELFASFSFEDMTGSIPAVIFPKSYAMVGHKLVSDTVYRMTGSILRREGEEPSFAVDDLEELVLDDEGLLPFDMYLGQSQISSESMAALRKVLLQYPGDTPVYLHIREKDKVVIYNLDKYPVSLDGEKGKLLKRELMELFGVSVFS